MVPNPTWLLSLSKGEFGHTHTKQWSEDEGRDWGDAEIKGCQNFPATPRSEGEAWNTFTLTASEGTTLDHRLAGSRLLFECPVAQSSPTLCDHLDCSPPGSSGNEISQARILEWVVIPYCKVSSQPMDRIPSLVSPALAGRFFTNSATWEATCCFKVLVVQSCLTLSDSMDCSPPGSSVHGIL